MMRKILTVLLLTILAMGALAYTKTNNKGSKVQTTKISTNNLLAISWQNAFCETHRDKRECRNVDPKGYAASHFTLHGLWPQPRHKVNCKGDRKVWLDRALYGELLEVMPAAKSGLHKHEWKKHGTCYGKSADLYFKDSIALIRQVNSSAVRDLFAKNAGKILTKKEVMQAFDKSFGKGSGRKVKMMCHQGLITELQLNLDGEISKESDIKVLLKSAHNAQGGCQKGKVDKVGFTKKR